MSLAAARRAAAAVRVQIEPLPAIVELAQASEVVETAPFRRGDLDRALAETDRVVTTRIESHRVHQAYLEPRAVLVEPTDGGLSVTMSTQHPFYIRAGLARAVRPPGRQGRRPPPGRRRRLRRQAALRHRAPGGGAGARHRAPGAARVQPREDMVTGAPRENSIVELTSAVDAGGRIRARRASIVLDAGAYALDTPSLVSLGAFYATGP